MANWFCSSAGWAAVTPWAALTSYNVGDIRRQLATPTVGQERVFRCTTAGISGAAEPAPWTLTKGSTTNDGTVVWTEITGDATYNTAGSWLAPHARMRIAVTWMVAGDTLYVRNDHAATEAAAVTITFPGTIAAPSKCVVVDTNLALSTGATETTTGLSALVINGCVYMETSAAGGMVFSAGSGANNVSLTLNNTVGMKQIYKNVDFIIAGTTSGNIQTFNTLSQSSGNTNETKLINCRFKVASTTSRIGFNAKLIIEGGSWLTGGSTPTSIFSGSQLTQGKECDVVGFDFSNLTATANMVVGAGVSSSGYINFRNCKLPTTANAASWSGLLFSTPQTTPGFIARMHNCDDGNTNYKIWEEDYCGTVKQEITIVRTSPAGASDGVTPISLKLNTPNAGNASFPLHFLRSPLITKRQNNVGSPITATIDIIHDSLTNLTNADIWVEVEYLGNSSFPLSTVVTDRVASVLATPVDKTVSTSTWTTTGLTNPNKQKLTVTFTPQQKGYVSARVCLALVNKTVYVNPTIDFS